MASTPAPPAPPNPSTVIAQQQQSNAQTAASQAAINNVSQFTPQGSFVYNKTGTGPNGVPTYSLTENLNPGLTSVENAVSGAAGNLARASAPGYSTPPNINPSEAVNAAVGMETQYLAPWFKQQQDVTNSNLNSQGLAPGDVAYDLAQKQLQENQTQAIEGAVTQFEPLAFNQQLQSYELPAQTIGALEGVQPGMPQLSTPQTGVSPTDVVGAYNNYQTALNQQYQSQLQNAAATTGGLFSIPSALLGGWARSNSGGNAITSGLTSLGGLFA